MGISISWNGASTLNMRVGIHINKDMELIKNIICSFLYGCCIRNSLVYNDRAEIPFINIILGFGLSLKSYHLLLIMLISVS